MTKLERLMQQAAFYEFTERPVPLTLESAIAAEGGSLTPIPDTTEETQHG